MFRWDLYTLLTWNKHEPERHGYEENSGAQAPYQSHWGERQSNTQNQINTFTH